MNKGWIVVSNGAIWCGAKKGKPIRVPPSWDENWEKELKCGVAIYDPFFGYAIDEECFLCSGVVITEPFVTPDGWTVELMLSSEFRKGMPISRYFPTLPKDEPQGMRVHFLLLSEPELERICEFLNDYELKNEFDRLLKWALWDNGWESLQAIFAERNCSVSEAKEIERILGKLLKIADKLKEKDDPRLMKEMQDGLRYLIFLLHMENESPAEWEKLWDRLCNDWQNYLLGSQISRLRGEKFYHI